MIIFYILLEIVQASFSGDKVSKAEFQNLLNSDQDLLIIIIKDDQMVALWNQLYQQHVDSIFMGVIDCQQADDLCSELGIEQTPQLLFVNKEAKALIYYDRQWNLDSITEWLVGDGDHDHSEEEYEIYIQVDQPKINENVQWVTDVENEDHKNEQNNHHDSFDPTNHHEDHHSENIEKQKYEEFQSLVLLNEQLSYRAEKFRRDIDLVKHQTNMLNTSFLIELTRQETTINFSIYLYASAMIAFVCVLFSWKKINVLNKKQSILVQ